MDNIELWLAPLLILPGVGMLIMSTSARYSRIHEEIHHLMHANQLHRDRMDHLYERTKLFRNALVSLYIAVSLFVLSGLLGGIWVFLDINGYWINTLISLSGLVCMLFASAELIRESILSHDIIKSHFEPLMESENSDHE